MKDYIKTLIVCGTLVVVAIIISPKAITQLGGSGIDSYGAQTTITSRGFGATATAAVTSTGGRAFISMQNLSAVPIYCLLDGSTAAADSAVTSTIGAAKASFILQPSSTAGGGYWENRGYVGNINCTSVSQTSSTVTTSP